MPTGYTADIEKDISFEDFLLGCARAFGACAHQRDETNKVKPRLDTVNTHYEDQLRETIIDLGALQTMTTAQKEATGKELQEETAASYQQYFNEKVLLKNKYIAMLEKAQAWNPPSADHIQLKQFMIDQINQSIRYDCDTDYWLKELSNVHAKKPIDFYNEKVVALTRDVGYYTEQLEKEKTRVETSNKWITVLYDSLGIEYE